jgi:thiamine-monophosphate kinase
MGKLDLRELGEFGLIEAIRRRTRGERGSWVHGIGDDAAVLRPRVGCDVVLTTDALIEDVHFRWRTTDALSLGQKALAASLSDLGAMGAEPVGCLLTLGLPAAASGERLDAFLRGLLRRARAAKCPLVGGDTVRARAWTVSVTAVGQLPRGTALLRSGARAGDRILVTGALGGSALGLALLERGDQTRKGAAPFVRRHLRPAPPWGAGAVLRRRGWGGGVIDVSDGLASDLAHVLAASGVGADVHLDRLPLPRGARSMAESLGLDAEALALSGGEDYELIFTVRRSAPVAAVIASALGCRVTEIGTVQAGRGARYFRDGVRTSAPERGFEHFKTP